MMYIMYMNCFLYIFQGGKKSKTTKQTKHPTESTRTNWKCIARSLYLTCVQTAYGDDGLSYTFSGNTVPAQPWISSVAHIRDIITRVTGFHFNFVLVNR